MEPRFFFLMSVACGLVAGRMAIAQSDYQCMATPVPAGLTQCGCPTVTVEDFCKNSMPMPGMGLITYYYCVGWTGSTCMPNAKSCGGEVWLCDRCSCDAGGSDQPSCNGSGCTQTTKQGFCGQNFGCE